MEFQVGDPVMHWTYGLGEIAGQEEREVNNQKVIYYVVTVGNLTVYVPEDGKIMSRLRPPTTQIEFKKLFKILGESSETLSEDRFERRNLLRKAIADGKAETVCRIVRDLTSLGLKKTLNDDDKNILKRAWNTLCGEWSFSLSLPPGQVDTELRHLLSSQPETIAV